MQPRPESLAFVKPSTTEMEDQLVMEFGAAGAETLEGRPGDFLYVAPGAVHRESNPSDQESHIVVVRSGSGVPVVNVEGPPAS